MEPPPAGAELTVHELCQHAARELAEETGIEVDPSSLQLWLAGRISNGNVGFFFLAPPVESTLARELHVIGTERDRANGGLAEFDELASIGDKLDYISLAGEKVDFLLTVLDAFVDQTPGA